MGVIPPPADITVGDTQIAFGDGSSNKLIGSDDFTFTKDAGSGPHVRIAGNRPFFEIRDDDGTDTYSADFQQSGASMYFHIQKIASGSTTRTEMLRAQPSSFVINDDGADVDFRLEGVSQANLIATNANDALVSIGGSSDAGAILTVNKSYADKNFIVYGDNANSFFNFDAANDTFSIRGAGDNTMLQLFSTGNGSTESPCIDLYSRNATDDADNLGKITWSARPSGSGSEVTKHFTEIRSEIVSNGPGGGDYDGKLIIGCITNNVMKDCIVLNGEENGGTVNITDASFPLLSRVNVNQYSASTTIDDRYCWGGFVNANMSDPSDRTLTLPAGLAGMNISIQTYGSVSAIIDANGSEKINGSASAWSVLDTQYSMASLYCYSDGYWSAAVGGNT